LLSILPEFSRNEGIESVQDLDRDRITRLVLSLEGEEEGSRVAAPAGVGTVTRPGV